MPAKTERAAEIPASNVLEMSVAELSGALKRTIEDRFGFVRVRGEISNYRGPHSSGHAYFCLKDDSARIDAVVWKTSFLRLKTKPQEGLEVIATGRVTTFPGKSTYQIVIESIEPAGIGALMAILEARRKALAAEGLFDEDRKRPLPFLPGTIGVITSPTGAVIRDILHRLADRFPCDVLVWPVRVQGDTAAEEVANAIAGFDALPQDGTITRPDVLIVARGGGSFEDLWAFNEENVVRAAAACSIPLISAVGHETDWTLIDHVADLRAPTPSGAAEKAVPVRQDLREQLARLGARQDAAAHRLVERKRGDVRALSRALPSADALVAVERQTLDGAAVRLASVMAKDADRRSLALARLSHRLSNQAPRARLAQMQHRLASCEQRLDFVAHRHIERQRRQLAHHDQRLSSLAHALRRDLSSARTDVDRAGVSLAREWMNGLKRRREQTTRCERLLNTLGYRQVLARGFALVRDASGAPVRARAHIPAPATLDIEFADGHIEAHVGSQKPGRLPRTTSANPIRQGSLFDLKEGGPGR